MAKGVPPEHTKFKKGQSGNPKGRPKKLPGLDEILINVLAEEQNGVTAIEAILKGLRNKAIKGDVKAAQLLIDRAYGKLTDNIDIKPIELPNIKISYESKPNNTESSSGLLLQGDGKEEGKPEA